MREASTVNNTNHGLKDGLFLIKAVALLCFVVLPFNGTESVIDRIRQISEDTYGMLGVVVFCGLWVLCIVAVVVTAFLPSFVARLVLALFIVPSTLASTIYASIASKGVTYEHIHTWWQERGLAESAVHAYPQALPPAALILCLGLLAILLPPNLERLSHRFAHTSLRRWVWVTSYSTAFGTILALCSLSVLQAGEGLDGLPVHYKGSVLFSAMMLNKKFVEQERAKAKVTVPLVSTDEVPPNVLLVINESIRGDYVDINKNQGLTPYLFSMRHRLTNFGYASSMANCSGTSHQGLRVGLNISKLAESQKRNPFIWQYAKAAGYKTVLIEGQVAPGQLNNNITTYEREMIDEFYYLSDPDQDEALWSRDQRLQEIVERVLGDTDPSRPAFIYVVQFGAHFPYDDKYPQSAVRFPLDGPEGTPLPPRVRTLNSYKNAIGWTVDPFFKAMLSGDRQFPNTVIVYTSDHGQDLMDSGEAVLHCTVHDPNPYEGLVPLLTITDHPQWKSRLELAARQNKDKASHFNIVPTILEIFGYESAAIKELHGSSLFDDIVEPRRFLSRGININVVTVGLQNKTVWNWLPSDLVSE